MCNLLGSRAVVYNKEEEAVEEALGARVQGIGEGVWGGCRQVLEEDCGLDSKEQLLAVLG